MNPNRTGPIKNPTKPIPETKDIPTEAVTPFTFPAIRNNSGIITESPKPKIPNPIVVISKDLYKINKYPIIATKQP